jgi:hypothetical protein
LKVRKVGVDGLLELEEMAVKLEATARKLPQGLKHEELLRDIERFRAQLAAQLSGLKAKGNERR